VTLSVRTALHAIHPPHYYHPSLALFQFPSENPSLRRIRCVSVPCYLLSDNSLRTALLSELAEKLPKIPPLFFSFFSFRFAQMRKSVAWSLIPEYFPCVSQVSRSSLVYHDQIKSSRRFHYSEQLSGDCEQYWILVDNG